MTLYEIEILNQDGEITTLKEYEGKVLLIVNTATGCGFTPQYKGLEELYREHKDKGFEVLDFPCNQFGHQAPGSDQEINSFCSLKYDTTFKRFKKIEVNGKNESPLYTFLKKEKGGIMGDNIKWNFTKFLVSKKGEVIKRYSPMVAPKDIEKDILEELNK